MSGCVLVVVVVVNVVFAPLDRLHFQSIPVVDVRCPGAAALIRRERVNGNPLVLTNHIGWVRFAEPWLRPGDGSLDVKSLVETVGGQVLTAINSISTRPESFHLFYVFVLSMQPMPSIQQIIKIHSKQSTPYMRVKCTLPRKSCCKFGLLSGEGANSEEKLLCSPANQRGNKT